MQKETIKIIRFQKPLDWSIEKLIQIIFWLIIINAKIMLILKLITYLMKEKWEFSF